MPTVYMCVGVPLGKLWILRAMSKQFKGSSPAKRGSIDARRVIWSWAGMVVADTVLIMNDCSDVSGDLQGTYEMFWLMGTHEKRGSIYSSAIHSE